MASEMVERPFVRVLFDFRYTDQTGQEVEILQGQELRLLTRSNDDWWSVRSGTDAKRAFYVPANYVEPFNKQVPRPVKSAKPSSVSEPPPESSEQSRASTEIFTDKAEEEVVGEAIDLLDSVIENFDKEVEDENPFEKAGDVTGSITTIPEVELYANMDTILRTRAAQYTDGENLYANFEPHDAADVTDHDMTPSVQQGALPIATLSGAWEVHLDQYCGRHCYLNTRTGLCQWKPPRNSLTLPTTAENSGAVRLGNGVTSLPAGWSRQEQGGAECYYHPVHGTWYSSPDEEGRSYFYSASGTETRWSLPDGDSRQSRVSLIANRLSPHISPHPSPRTSPRASPRSSPRVSPRNSVVERRGSSPQRAARRAVRASVHGACTQHSGVTAELNRPGRQLLRRMTEPELQDSGTADGFLLSSALAARHRVGLQSKEKKGNLWRAKIAEDGRKINTKKVEKLWVPSFAVISGTTLFCYKDKDSAELTGAYPPMPSLAVQLLGSRVEFGSKEHKIHKKTVFQVSCARHVFLFHAERPEDCHEWYMACHAISQQSSDVTTRSLPRANVIEHDVGSKFKKKASFKRSATRSQLRSPTASGGRIDTEKPEKSEVLERLIAFFKKRPNAQALHEKGILKDTVFGAPLDVVCKRDKSTVPKFLRECVEAIERKGVDSSQAEGMYRVPANMSAVNKLRNAVDQDNYDLDSCDFHVLCGALKLFLREMSDSLIPTPIFDKLITVLSVQERKQRVSGGRELLHKLPKNHLATLQFLLQHLLKVQAHSDKNRMEINAIAIVFGPNLFKPEVMDAKMAVYAAYQNHVVQFFLLEYQNLFGK